jgi:hypothetical protein
VGDSIFTQHVYGIASLASPLSYLFPTHYHYFAASVGATFALTFLAPFLAVMALAERAERGVARAAIAFVTGLVMAASGPVIAALGFPHYEIGVPCLFVVFVSMHFLGWSRVKWIALLLGLLVREDAGMHYAGYSAVIGAYQWFSGTRPMPTKTWRGALVLSLAVSAAILLIQRRFFPIGASMFYKSFIGDPPFAQLAGVEIARRLTAVLQSARHLYVPMAVIAGAAVIWRTPAFLLGYLACVPWIVLNVFLGLTPASETLSLYYGFPLLAGLMWPLLAPHWMASTPRSRSRPLAIGVCLAAGVASVVVLQGNAFVVQDALAGGAIPSRVFGREADCLESAFRSTPKLYADTTVVAMFPHSVPARRVLNLTTEVAVADADAFVFYDDRMARTYASRAQALGLTYATELAVPRIRVLSREPSVFAACLGLGFSGR